MSKDIKLNVQRQAAILPNPLLCAAFSTRSNPMSELYNMDCVEGMKHYPDKYFDLAIVDPPYGIGEAGKKMVSRHHTQKKYVVKDWDKNPPPLEYFYELFRCSKNQIIFGANHFIDLMPYSSSGWIFWDKDRYGDFADGELAWTSFNKALRKVKFTWDGFRKQVQEERFHPTQKPKELYQWILDNYAEKGQRILDTHVGSGSNRIACFINGFDFVGFEIDKEYCEQSEKFFVNITNQQRLSF